MASVIESLGLVYYEAGNYPEAHRDIATGLHNLAEIRRAVGEPAEAEALYREALAMRRTLFETAHPHVAVSLTGLGTLLQEQGDLNAARELLAEALDVRRTFVADDAHPAVAARDRLNDVQAQGAVV